MRHMLMMGALMIGLAGHAYAGTPTSAESPVPTVGSIDEKNPGYVQIRTAFLNRVTKIYFAIGCKALPGGEFGAIPLINYEGMPLIKESLSKNLTDPKLHVMISNAGFKGLNQAAKDGQCAYWREHQEELASLRHEAETAWNDDSASQ